ncbi:MAG TPA: hypothetical protein VJK29_19470 [Terriglobales bacterium]|nr:hypothetical protein [Terriglobales bacterium]
MNWLSIVVTSAAVSALISAIFNLISQWFERSARRKDLIFRKALELAIANREFITQVAKDTGHGAQIHDYVVYAEMYHWLLTSLHETGSLPAGWRGEIKTKFGF